MRNRFRLIHRGNGYYYWHDTVTGERQSLETRDKVMANRLLMAKNQSFEQPALNLAMARAYLMGKSPQMVTRTWKDVMDAKEERYRHQGVVSTLKRWQKVCRSQPFQHILDRCLVETEPEHFLSVLHHPQAGTSTNVWLRILHNYALDMSWLLAPVLAKKVWPKIQYRDRRGITEKEHLLILEKAKDHPEECNYYKLLWETGGSQTDIATLTADRIDWEQKSLLYRRMKTQQRGYEFAKIRLGKRLLAMISELPQQDYLLPNLASMSMENRSRMFRRRCESLGFKNLSLHCYRYAWAERARKANMPIRAAMETLGHKSRAVHQAYAKKVEVDLFPLEYYEEKQAQNIILFAQHPNEVHANAVWPNSEQPHVAQQSS